MLEQRVMSTQNKQITHASLDLKPCFDIIGCMDLLGSNANDEMNALANQQCNWKRNMKLVKTKLNAGTIRVENNIELDPCI